MPKQRRRGRGGRATCVGRATRATRSRTSTRASVDDQPAADSQPTIADDTTLSSLQLGQFLELVRAEVREEMQSHQGQLAATESSAAHQLLAYTSPMGLVPKLHQLNKFRLIVDLSHPIGASVNDDISPDLCSLRYASVDEAVNVIRRLGRDAQLTKLDIKDAYRIIPVHPDDYHLLGISWRGATYIDRVLPFGLRSAPKIFSAVADLVLHQQGIKHQLHYLDDFLFLDAATPQGSTGTLEQVLRIFQGLGIPIATQKTEGANTALVFLGILIDTHRFELRLPLEKLTRLQTALQHWEKKRSCTRRELESLLGHLLHAATVVRQGRTFLRQLFPLLSLNRAPHHWIRLNAAPKLICCGGAHFCKAGMAHPSSQFPPPLQR